MIDYRSTARGLLIALRSVGFSEDADALEENFNIKNWEITEQDIKIINVLLTQDPQIQPESDNQNPIFQCLDLFGAFFEKSLAHDNLVKSLTTLGRVPDSAILMSTLCDIFVDILGYNERPIDATKRLGEQKTFSKLQSFAGFGDFVVSIAETKTNVPYTNTYKPIFQIYPYGLCIVVNPAHGWIRFVFSQSGQNTRKLNYRTFVGRRGRSVNDNLLTWIRRLHLIKPQFGDDHSKLRMRVEAAFSVNPSDLADRWDSRPFTSTEIPGFPWSDLCFNECRSFLQIDDGAHIHWGLESVLQDCFPMSIGNGKEPINYRHYNVQPISYSNNLNEMIGGNTFSARINIELEMKNTGEIFSMPCIIPIANRCGHFCIDGQLSFFEPYINRHGLFEAHLLGGHMDLLEDYSDAFLDRPENINDDNVADDVPNDEEEVIGVMSASTRVLMEIAVFRKLGALALRLKKTQSAEDEDPLRIFNRVISQFSNQDGYIELYSKPFLGRILRPVSISSPEKSPRGVVGKVDGKPPMWACLATSGIQNTKWFPVLGARLHPAGKVCIPNKRGGELTLSCSTTDAFNLVDSTPLNWFLTPALRSYQTTKFLIEGVEALYRKGIHRSFERIFFPENAFELEVGLNRQADISFTDTVLYVDREYLFEKEKKETITQHFIVDIPVDLSAKENSEKPELLLKVGDSVFVGLAWLKIPRLCWSGFSAPNFPRSIEMIAKLMGRELGEAWLFYKIPSGVSGKVGRVTISPVHGKYGTLLSWRATIEITRYPKFRKVVLPDGTLVRIQIMNKEDAPFCTDSGRPLSLVFSCTKKFKPTDEVMYYDQSGEIFEGLDFQGEVVWIPELPRIHAFENQQHRLIDNEPVVQDSHLYLTEEYRRWLRLAFPEIAKFVEKSTYREQFTSAGWKASMGALSLDLELLGLKGLVEEHFIKAGPVRFTSGKEESIDPIKTRRFGSYGRENIGGFTWQCNCGVLNGTTYAGNTCSNCSSVVRESISRTVIWECDCGVLTGHKKLRDTCDRCYAGVARKPVFLSEIERQHIQLPVPIIHPWKKFAIAFVLGITASEFNTLLKSVGPTELLRFGSRAFDNPTSAMKRRMQTSSEQTKQLGQLVFKQTSNRDTVELHSVPVLPSRFLMYGIPLGAPSLMHGGLSERYRDLRLAIEQYQQLSRTKSAELGIISECALQESVDQIFGELDKSSEHIHSFSSLLNRLWPISRPEKIRSSIPAIARLKDELIVSCVTTSGPSFNYILPQRRRVDYRPFCEIFWQEGQAFHLLTTKFLSHLAGIFDGISWSVLDKERIVQLKELGLQDDDNLAIIGAREFLYSISKSSSCPTKLLDILGRQLPIQLPVNPTRAIESLNKYLGAAFPESEDVSVQITIVLMSFALEGWWNGPISFEYPLGWRLEKPAIQLKGWRRKIPPFTSVAWDLWHSYAGFSKPISWLLEERNYSPLFRNFLGVDIDVPRPRWWAAKNRDFVTSTEKIVLTERNVNELPEEKEVLRFTKLKTMQKIESSEILVLRHSIANWLESTKSSPLRTGKRNACKYCAHPPGMHQCCGKCRITANGELEIEVTFGFRKITRKSGSIYAMPQPWCRKCRKTKKGM